MLRLFRRSWLPYSVLFGALLLLASLGWLRHGITFEDEKLLIQASSMLRSAVAPPSDSLWKDFVFIDTSYDPMLVAATGAEGLPLGTRPVVDRRKLAALFRILGDAGVHRFVLCDVLFLDPSEADAELQTAINGVPRVLIPYSLDAGGNPVPPVIDAPKALARYRQDGGSFVRFPLVQAGSLATVPLDMHRALYPDEEILGPLHLRTFVPDLRLPAESMPAALPLGQLLPLLSDPEQVRAYFQDRIVVIGAFGRKTDSHDTVFGPMPGPLVLTNVYLGLRHDDHRLSVWLLLFLWSALGGLTWYSLRRELGPTPAPSAEIWVDGDAGSSGPPRTLRERLREIGADGTENTIALVIISLATYFTFGLHLPVLLLAVLLTAFVGLMRRRHRIRLMVHAAWTYVQRRVNPPAGTAAETASPSAPASSTASESPFVEAAPDDGSPRDEQADVPSPRSPHA
jgi:hypothetical protein